MNAAPPRIPYLTLALLAANLGLAIAAFVNLDLVETLGFHPDSPRLLQALVSIFVHANTAHLLGNLVFLAAVGAAVELATGPVRYGVVYMVSGLFGVAVYWLSARRLPDPPVLVGASGAVAGCAVYYASRYHALRVLVAPGRAISILAVTGFWVTLQVLGAFLVLGGAVSGRAFFAHLGGAVAGYLLSLSFRAPDLERRRLGHEVLDRMNARGPDLIAAAAREHLIEHPNDPKALERLADALRDLGEPDAEADCRLRLLAVVEGDPRRLALARLLELDPARLPARRRLQMAGRVASDDLPLARKLLLSILDDPVAETDHPDALLALATLTDPPDHDLLVRLLRNHPLSDAADLARRRGVV